MLAIYDPWVIGFMAPVVWRSPVHPTVARYRRHLGRRHLDVGAGTGYFIEKADPPEDTEITLLDPNPNVLARSSRRLAALHPVTVEADVMKRSRSRAPSTRQPSAACSTSPRPPGAQGRRDPQHRRRA